MYARVLGLLPAIGFHDRELHIPMAHRRGYGKAILPLAGLVDNIVNDSVLLRLLRVHDEVALHVFLNFF